MFIIRRTGSPEWPADAWMRVWVRLPEWPVDAWMRVWTGSTRMACGCVDACLDSITRNALAFQGFTPNPLNYFWAFELTRFPCCVFIMTQARSPEWPVDEDNLMPTRDAHGTKSVNHGC